MKRQVRRSEIAPLEIGIPAPLRAEPRVIDLDGGVDVVDLSDAAAVDPGLTGAKAAALARAADGGLPVLPGFVVTTHAASELAARGTYGDIRPDLHERIHRTWIDLTHGGKLPLVVRSSSTGEDGAESSMAGMFTSVLDVRGWDQFTDALMTVIRSAGVISLDGERVDAPMAVLVQPFLMASRGGILFGVDPVTGNSEHLTVVAIEGGPDALVSGREEGVHYLLNHSGRLLGRQSHGSRLLSARDRRALARLSRTAKDYFGGPQDIEWAMDPAGQLFLLQSRPVTAVAATAAGPILGPGPVAETFPDPLSPLEEDLWIAPLREGVEHALLVGGATTRRKLSRSPVVTTVGGRIAADLELFGIKTGKRSFLAKLDPREPARRMMAAWRVGRLKAALPGIAGAMVRRLDQDLGEVPELSTLGNKQLLDLTERGRAFLVGLHGYEVLAGLLTEVEEGAPSGAEIALTALMLGRSEGFSDEEMLRISPEVLALTPPAIEASPDLPGTPSLASGPPRRVDDLGAREALRLRIRWVQELMARAVWELGTRLKESGRLPRAKAVRLLTFDELGGVVDGTGAPANLSKRSMPTTPPLPAAFQLATDGSPVPVRSRDHDTGARGAGGGRGIGRVHRGVHPSPGDVLVVSTLDPSLAPLLPSLGGLVAETGNVLSHLAILAREFGVPTVVGLEGAIDRFAEGSVIVVDGTTGEVSEVAEA